MLRFFRQRQRERDLERELRNHLDLEADESGSHWAARRALGNITQIKEEVRTVWGLASVDPFAQDVRFALRTFRANPNFTLTVVISLALGIGATCAMFSVIYGVLIDPFIYKDAKQIIVPTYSEPDSDNRRPTLYYTSADFIELQAHSKAFQSVILTDSDVAVTDGPSPANVHILSGSANFFEFFGTPALLGRTFASGDVPNPQDPPEIAVIGHKLWMKQFNGSPDAIGRDLKLGGHVYKVIGVMPSRFGWFDTDVFVPAAIRPLSRHQVWAFMRLRPGVSLGAAGAELQSFTERFAKRNPSMYPKLPFHLYAVPLQDWLLGKFPGKLLILMTAVSFLLLITCGNVSILLLARGEARKQEISMRVALGASTSRIFQQLLTEALLLASAGCLLGILLAFSGVPAVLALLPEDSLPHESVVNVNLNVLAFTVLVSFGTGVVSGLFPALSLMRTTIHTVVQSGNRATAAKSRISARTLLLVSEVALTTLLLFGAIVGLQHLSALYQADLGYDPKDVAVVNLGWLHNSKESVGTRQAFYKRMAEALRKLPGITAVTETLGAVPPALGKQSAISLAGGDGNLVTASVGLVGSEYFTTLKTPILGGRMFGDSEVRQRSHVAVVNQAFARLLGQQGLSPVGRQIWTHGISDYDAGEQAGPEQAASFQIVGIAATVENQAMQQASKPAIYLPYTYWLRGELTFLIRTAGNPYHYEQMIQRQIRAFELPGQPVAEFDDLQHILTMNALSDPKSGASLLTIFSSLAMALAAVGLYSVVSFSVARRNKEIAIRTALGAQSGQVAAIILRSTLAVTSTGIATGLLGSFVFGKTLAFYEQGWRPREPLALLLVPALVLLVSLIASLAPTWRAVCISPSEALRND